ncbi:hypothetical protein G6F37_011271 [Rhizopus arrhizus]|nr:hypothetical protein G6F38_012645 [Rhizopus arrhizus]KAG1150133.1 hypothetical protein G6F37_011271 [Rhizopus arrhizus]
MNYSQNYDNLPENTTLSTNSNEFHPYQVLTDSTRQDISPLVFHNNLISTCSPSEPWNNNNNNNESHVDLASPSRELSVSQRGVAGFVAKLYQCLQAPDSEQRYARWCTRQGRDMFVIECIPEFTQTVLPRLFKHCKFQSFVRQLNIYGFQRDTDARKTKDSKDKESCRWFHPFFRPDRRDMLHMIRRKAAKSTRRRQVKEEDSETILKMEGEEDSGEDDLTDHRRSSSSASSVHVLDYASPPLSATNPLLHLTTPLVEPQHPINEFEPFVESDNNENEQDDLAIRLFEAEQRFEKMETYYRSKITEQQLRIQALENAFCFPDVKPNTGYISTMCPSSSNSYYNQPPYNMTPLQFNNSMLPENHPEHNNHSNHSWIPSSFTSGSMHNAKQ